MIGGVWGRGVDLVHVGDQQVIVENGEAAHQEADEVEADGDESILLPIETP